MKKPVFLVLLCLAAFSCGDDDERTCRFCSSDQTPEFELCRESNGNASINGEDTGTNYEAYLDDLVEAGANCGG
ncbi:hypothetical protein G5B37_09925 [Rasiella rasia]|uniref:Uncharacterized protein n=1 Tax=Rasiella rasia TaxID=2744027 RepID=A0A6G6GQ78_9FLAO|nr:hypothetical protein [Rasiella rasia]QIE59871.1 hypothetical protein G5B37_09925 [Rasiella rasia]